MWFGFNIILYLVSAAPDLVYLSLNLAFASRGLISASSGLVWTSQNRVFASCGLVPASQVQIIVSWHGSLLTWASFCITEWIAASQVQVFASYELVSALRSWVSALQSWVSASHGLVSASQDWVNAAPGLVSASQDRVSASRGLVPASRGLVLITWLRFNAIHHAELSPTTLFFPLSLSRLFFCLSLSLSFFLSLSLSRSLQQLHYFSTDCVRIWCYRGIDRWSCGDWNLE